MPSEADAVFYIIFISISRLIYITNSSLYSIRVFYTSFDYWGSGTIISTGSGHRTAVSEVDGGSVKFLVTRGSEGVTQYLLIDYKPQFEVGNLVDIKT